MSDIVVWDISAGINIALAVCVIILEINDFIRLRTISGRWIFLFKAVSAFIVIVVMVSSLLRLYPAPEYRIVPEVGRPTYMILLTALALGSLFQHRRGRCNDGK